MYIHPSMHIYIYVQAILFAWPQRLRPKALRLRSFFARRASSELWQPGDQEPKGLGSRTYVWLSKLGSLLGVHIKGDIDVDVDIDTDS